MIEDIDGKLVATSGDTPGARDGCVVDSKPLAEIVCRFVENWERDRPSNAGRFSGRDRRTSAAHVGAVDWLSSASGVSAATISNLTTRDRSTGRVTPTPRSRTTELRIADPLVAALGRPQALHDGTLEVRPNPNASAAARARCCSGSLNGSLTERL